MMTYRIRKYIGAYSAALGGVDVIAFTAGVGENSNTVRGMVCRGLEYLGIQIDDAKNDKTHGIFADISHKKAKVKTLVVPTNEEVVIARETIKFLK
jgi:acetate kinase